MSRLASALLAMIVLWWLPARPLEAQEGRGFGELRLSLFPGADGRAFQTIERLRPSMTTELSERVKLVATIEAGIRQGRDTAFEFERALRGSAFGPLLEAANCEFPQPENGFLRINNAHDYLAVDRLYFDIYTDLADVRIGRQALNWGSAQFFNPTDPFPQVLLAEPWRPRSGVNALRVSVPFGDLNDFTAVAASNDAFTAARAAGRLRINWLDTDFALVGAYRGDQSNGLVGVDIRGTLELGYWLEAAYFIGPKPHEELSVGVDYSFPILERALIFLQYYRNGAGSPDPSRYAPSQSVGAIAAPSCENTTLPLSGAAEPDPFAPFTKGRDYLIASASLVVLVDLSSTLALVQNLNDGSGLLVPTVTYAALDWLDVSMSAQVPFALRGGGEFKPSAKDLSLELEAPDGELLRADLSGLVPAATITLWSRASF